MGPSGPQGESGIDVMAMNYLGATGNSGLDSNGNVIFNTLVVSDLSAPWASSVNNTTFTCPATGIYLISYKVKIQFNGTTAPPTTTTLDMEARLNGALIPGSQGAYYFIQATNPYFSVDTVSVTILILVTAGQNLTIHAAMSVVVGGILNPFLSIVRVA
jgi:hypothetical protein